MKHVPKFSLLCKAIKIGNAELVQSLREEYGAHLMDAKEVLFPNTHQRLMSYAVRKSYNPTVTYLIEDALTKNYNYGGNGLDFHLDMINPPLIEAARMGNLELVRKLVNSGADINKRKDDKYGTTPLLKGQLLLCGPLLQTSL